MESSHAAGREKLVSALACGIEERREVLSAYLFGSMATGHARPGSDVDVAVRLVDGLSPEDRFRIRIELIESMEKRIGRAVDVIVLNDAALVLVNQVFSKGVAIFVRDPYAEEMFVVLKQKEFFDFRYYLDRDFRQMGDYFGGNGHGGK